MPARRKSAQPAKRTYRELSFSDDDQPPPAAKRKSFTMDKKVSKKDDPGLDDSHSIVKASTQQILRGFKKTHGNKEGEFLTKLQQKLSKQRQIVDGHRHDTDSLLSKEEIEFRKALTSQLATAATLLSANSITPAEPSEQTSEASLRQSSARLLKLTYRLIEKYTQASELVHDVTLEGTLGQSWLEDREALATILNAGRKFAERQVIGIITRGGENEDERLLLDQEANEQHEAASNFGFKIQEDTATPGLSEVLAHAERTVKRLAMVLPMPTD